jgi:AcrR family transcriptional regulator
MGRPKTVDDDAILEAARRCFLKHGSSVSISVIARELQVSHTTVFNRFGTKEALMLAALGPPRNLPWISMLESGPDERPLADQLAEFGIVVVEFFHDLIPRLEILWAVGVSPKDVFSEHEVPAPMVAHRALAAWFCRAIDAGRVRATDPDLLALLTIGALRAKPFTERVCGMVVGGPDTTEGYVRGVCLVLLGGFGVDEQRS